MRYLAMGACAESIAVDNIRMKAAATLAAVMLGCLGWVSGAQAQAMTDLVTVTAGGIYDGPVSAGFRSNSVHYGAAHPTVTSNGYAYLEICDNGSYTRKSVGVAPSSQISIGGFGANPGQGWLTSVSALGVTTSGSKATYTYSAGVATWSWIGTSWGIQSGTVQVSVTHGAPPIGYLDLKYLVVAIDYAPPGAKSNVSYTNSTVRGTEATDSSSYKTDVDVTDTGDIGADLFGVLAGSLTGTTDIDYQQMTGNNNSTTVTNTDTNTDTVPGPGTSALGVDHDYDVIWVWLNPVASEYVGPNTVSFAGYGFSAEDDYSGAEIVPIMVAQLKNPSTMKAGLVARLARSWDTSGLGGLSTADYADILTLDPFATSSTYNPATDTKHRFQPLTDTTVPYVPPAPGGQPVTVTGSFMTQTATSESQTAQTQYTVKFTLLFSSDIDFIAQFGEKLQVSTSYTVTDMWSTTNNETVGKTASYSVTGPQYSDNYTGPVSFQVYRDNVYGSFMFYPLQ